MSPRHLLLSLALFISPAAAQETSPPFRDCETCPEMVSLPAGEFTFGSPLDELGRHEGEALSHPVAISQPFAISIHEITVGQYQAFVEATDRQVTTPCWAFTHEAGWDWHDDANWSNTLFPQTNNHPVACVSWHDAAAYALWLSEETGEPYRLPTEEEWEYAARAGTTGPRTWQGPREDVCAHANINDISGKNRIWKVAEPCDDGWLYTARVGFFIANPFGLYDMQGNVWEWTQTCDSEGMNPDAACPARVLRGGAWFETPGPIRISVREWRDPNERFAWAGFRLVREVE